MGSKNTNCPIRILHVVTYMGRGGLETMIMNYYRHVDRNKVQFDFLVHRDLKADYDDEIISLGGRIFRLPRLIPWSYGYRKALKQFFKSHTEYKIVHVHQDCLSSIVLKAAQKSGVPVRIAHSHSSSQDKDFKYLIKLYYKRKIKNYATNLFACGKEAGDWMFRGEKYQLINNAINSKSYKYNEEYRKNVRDEFQISDDMFVIGHVGRFNTVKNHTFLLDVFVELKQIHSRSKLMLVGDGELREKIESKAEELGIKESVIFTGVRNDVAKLMSVMSCFVFPSLYEGLPVTLIEAQAAGLPCIISDNISSECDKTGLVERISLNDSSSFWAEKIINKLNYIRRDTSNEIEKAGYDISVNAEQLQKFYLDRWKEAI